MPDPAPCGLRLHHDPHPTDDAGRQWCDGQPAPQYYDPTHRGRYQAELDWWPYRPPSCEHRAKGDPVLADHPPSRRPRLRLRWRDGQDAGAD